MNHTHTITSKIHQSPTHKCTQYLYIQFAQAKQFNWKLFCNCTGTRLFVFSFFSGFYRPPSLIYFFSYFFSSSSLQTKNATTFSDFYMLHYCYYCCYCYCFAVRNKDHHQSPNWFGLPSSNHYLIGMCMCVCVCEWLCFSFDFSSRFFFLFSLLITSDLNSLNFPINLTYVWECCFCG